MSGHGAFLDIAKAKHRATVGQLRPLKPGSLTHFEHVPEHLPDATGLRAGYNRQRDVARLGVAIQRAAMKIR